MHFLIAGALIFAMMAGRPPDLGERRIVVNAAVIARLGMRWTETFRRPPTTHELDGLIGEYVRDQVYYREAIRLGLDQDDEVVVRRLRNKMIALATSDTEAAKPDDRTLQALLDKNPARYAPELRFTFQQVYLGADSPAVRRRASGVIARLQAGAAPSAAGQPVPIPGSYRESPASDLAGLFGDEFVTALRSIPPGRWIGPVSSGLGLHAVRLTARTAPAVPDLATVRQQLENDWRSAALRRAEDDNYRRILAGYDVVFEQPR